jgi:uncharacterized protein YjbI with pentapeptide repeats
MLPPNPHPHPVFSLLRFLLDYLRNQVNQLKKPRSITIGLICIFSVVLVGWILPPIFWPGGIGIGKGNPVSTKTIEIDKQGKTVKTIETIKDDEGKTLWDWLSLLGVPLSLAILGYILQEQQQKRADNETKEEVLQTYFDRLSVLLIDKNLIALSNKSNLSTITPEEQELLDSALDVIRARTLSILRRFKNDAERKGSVIDFLIETEIIGKSKLNLSRADLSGANLSGANLEEAYLKGAYLGWAKLKEANFSGANLEGANLSGANLEGANLSGANLFRANLSGETNLFRANLSGANLKWANLSGANLKWANLSGTNLYEANLSGANLEGANLSGANLKWANLSGANLSGANLYVADLEDANLSEETNLSGANLEWANIKGTNLERD